MREMKITLGDNQKVDALFKGFLIRTDQTQSAGGEGTEPSPFDLFLASIGTCAGFYVKSFCRQRNIPEDNIELIQRMYMDNQSRMITKVEIDIILPDDFPPQYKLSIIKAAEACSVKKHISNAPEFIVNTSN
ncbi:MAG: osmotically inducible protein C [Bacteroidia bacterium]|nr:MAG: osmotically inducible protein C [Bacteroidia bacterium]